jgi:hypothetical protein
VGKRTTRIGESEAFEIRRLAREGMPVPELARRARRTPSSIYKVLKQLGVNRTPAKAYWTWEEINRLAALIDDGHDAGSAALILGRPRRGVLHKAWDQGMGFAPSRWDGAKIPRKWKLTLTLPQHVFDPLSVHAAVLGLDPGRAARVALGAAVRLGLLGKLLGTDDAERREAGSGSEV